MRARRWPGVLAAALLCGAAHADDEGALQLADQAPDVHVQASNTRAFVEGGLVTSGLRYGQPDERGERLSTDLYTETALAPGLRVVFSDRLDLEHVGPPSDRTAFNTVKEGYLSWQPSAEQIIDVGRVNLRYGVATGYNPTDFFKTDAIREIVSLDPSSLRENRLGTVLVESQTLWEGASLTALVSPKLADQADAAPLDLDVGATNGSTRWLVVASRQFTNNFNPQLLVFGGEHMSDQIGVDVSAIASDALVVYLEAAAGREPSLVDAALLSRPERSFQRRASLGISYTTDFNLTVTLEAELNSAGLAGRDWARLTELGRSAELAFLETTQSTQELPTQSAAFVSASWTDAFVKHLDLSTFGRRESATQSSLVWAEARYHFDRADLALQWNIYAGRTGSLFGSIPAERTWQLLLRYFL